MRCEPEEEDPFSFEGPEIYKCSGSSIDWLAGKNLTVKQVGDWDFWGQFWSLLVELPYNCVPVGEEEAEAQEQGQCSDCD